MHQSLLLAAGAVAVLSAAPLTAQLSVGSSAPEMDVKEWFAPPISGTTLEELRGRVVFVEFWATW